MFCVVDCKLRAPGIQDHAFTIFPISLFHEEVFSLKRGLHDVVCSGRNLVVCPGIQGPDLLPCPRDAQSTTCLECNP